MPSPQTSVRSLLIAWLPTLAWLIVIAFESTSFFSGGQTMLWTRRLLSLFIDHPSFMLAYQLNHLLRKTGHFIGYATLSWFAFRGWMETLAWQRERYLLSIGRPVEEKRRWHLRAAILGVLVTIAVAALDEFHQSHLRGRTGVFRDVVLDTMGGIFAQCLLLLYWTRKKRGEVSTSRAKTISPVTAEET
jgi:VanZ family protein